MPYPIELKFLGLGKETTRGVAVNPTRFIAVTRDTEMEYRLTLIEDELIRGIFARFPPMPGIKEGTGTINIEVQSDNIGEFLLSLLGRVVTTSPATGVYLHTFDRHPTLITLPSYTIYLDRRLVRKRYPLSVVKSITFTGTVDGKVTASISVLFKREEPAPEVIPTWTPPAPFMFYQTFIKIADTLNLSDIKEWSLTIDNESIVKRTLSGSQDIDDILSFGKMLINGSMSIYFENEVEREKFLSNTATSLEILLEGATITGDHKNSIRFILPRVHYTAYPFGELDGMLGAAVTFNCYYSLPSAYAIKIELKNTVSSY